MSTTARTTLLVAVTCAAFVVGAAVGTVRKAEHGPGRSALSREAEKPESEPVGVQRLRKALAKREQKILALETDLAEARAKLPRPLSPEEEKRKREEEETRRRAERRRAALGKSDELRRNILQRRDKALRQEGLAELAALVESGDPEELLVGLTTLPRLYGLNFEKESFKPQILTALSHEDPEIRRAALECVQRFWTPRGIKNIMLSMAGDPSTEIRLMVLGRLRVSFRTRYRREEITVLRGFFQDNDSEVRRRAMAILYRSPEYAEEIDDLRIEMSREPENAEAMIRCFTSSQGSKISEKVARRLMEMFEEGHEWDNGERWTRFLPQKAKPVVIDFFLRVVRDSIDIHERTKALSELLRIADASLVPQLQEIASSEDAEGIERGLASTIEHLQRKAQGQQ